MTTRIVTDSTADLPFKLVNEYGIAVVPLNIHFGEEVLRDGVDIWSEEFYHRLRNDSVLPNTSQPAPGDFLTTYQKVAQPGDTIISLHISKELSGTVGSAQVAASMLGNESKVELIDSRSVSMGLGLMVLQAARMAATGRPEEEILAKIHSMQQQMKIFFTVNSLEFLQRTGRIGKAAAFLGCLLNIKPLLGIVDGIIIPVAKIRGNFRKVAMEMIDNLVEEYGQRPLLASIVHTELTDEFHFLRNYAQEKLNISELVVNLMGPIVGSHAGPETIGIIAVPIE